MHVWFAKELSAPWLDISYTPGYRNPSRTSVPAHLLHANIVRPGLNTQPIQLNKYIPQRATTARSLRKPALESFTPNPRANVFMDLFMCLWMWKGRHLCKRINIHFCVCLCVWYRSIRDVRCDQNLLSYVYFAVCIYMHTMIKKQTKKNTYDVRFWYNRIYNIISCILYGFFLHINKVSVLDNAAFNYTIIKTVIFLNIITIYNNFFFYFNIF